MDSRLSRGRKTFLPRPRISFLCALLAIPGADVTWAATRTATALVSATVPKSCVISIQPISFGTYDPTGAHAKAALDTTTTLSLSCTKSAVAAVGLDQGLYPASGSTPEAPARQLASGNQRLRYALFRDASRTAPWGDIGTMNAVSFLSVGKDASPHLTVYARIPEQQKVHGGEYADQLTATVFF